MTNKSFKGDEDMVKTKIGSGGGRKHGRNKDKCQKYIASQHREKNKVKKWKKLIKKLSPENDMRRELEKKIEKYESKII